MINFLSTSFLMLFTGMLLQAQPEVVNWTLSAEKTNDQEYKLTLQAEIKEGWYLYSQFLESDEGPIATKLHFEKSQAFTLHGDATEEGEKIEAYDKVFMMNIAKYKETVSFVQVIKIKEAPATIAGFIEFMTCDDEQCLPPKEMAFSFEIE